MNSAMNNEIALRYYCAITATGKAKMKDETGNMKVEELSWSLFHISSFRFHISATGDGQ